MAALYSTVCVSLTLNCPSQIPSFLFFIPLPTFTDATVVSNGIYSRDRGIVVTGVAMAMVVVVVVSLCVHTLTYGRRDGWARAAVSTRCPARSQQTVIGPDHAQPQRRTAELTGNREGERGREGERESKRVRERESEGERV